MASDKPRRLLPRWLSVLLLVACYGGASFYGYRWWQQYRQASAPPKLPEVKPADLSDRLSSQEWWTATVPGMSITYMTQPERVTAMCSGPILQGVDPARIRLDGGAFQASSDPEIAAKLNLTEQQQAKLAKAPEFRPVSPGPADLDPLKPLFAKLGSASAEQRPAAEQAVLDACRSIYARLAKTNRPLLENRLKVVEAALTAEQAKQLSDLVAAAAEPPATGTSQPSAPAREAVVRTQVTHVAAGKLAMQVTRLDGQLADFTYRLRVAPPLGAGQGPLEAMMGRASWNKGLRQDLSLSEAQLAQLAALAPVNTSTPAPADEQRVRELFASWEQSADAAAREKAQKALLDGVRDGGDRWFEQVAQGRAKRFADMQAVFTAAQLDGIKAMVRQQEKAPLPE